MLSILFVTDKNLLKLIQLHQEAANCNVCFQKYKTLSHKVVVKGAQPRSIGKNYFSQKIKVCLVLINPGSADTLSDDGWDEYLVPLKEAKTTEEKNLDWRNIQDFIKREEPYWGKIKGNWGKLYYESLGLDKDNIAMVNIMMCGEDKDNYTSQPTLDECFFKQRRSLKIIKSLKPDKIILSGIKPIQFFCKKPLPKSLTSLREKRNNFWNKVLSSKGEEALKKIEFQKINKSKIKEEIRTELPDSDFYWIGHYAARNVMFEEAVEDAETFAFTSL